MKDDLYNHFLSFYLAVRILASPEYEKAFNHNAKQLLVNFVENAIVLYGESFMSRNVHTLIHIADDCLRFGLLDAFSCFEF